VALERRAEIELLAGPKLAVHVVDLSGAPIAGARVRARYWRETDRDGRVLFRAVSMAQIQIPGAEIYAHSRGPSDFIQFDKANGQGHWQLDCFGPGPIALSARNELDVPVPAPPIVHVTSVSDGHSYETSTHDGEFVIGQLSPGDYKAVLDDDERTATTFHVAPSQATMVAMTLP
jgi:hypothetical protein